MSQPVPLPDEFSYLSDVLNRYTNHDGNVSDYDHLIASFTADDLKRVSEAYEEIVRRDDTRALSTFISQSFVPGKPMTRAWELFQLFDALARKGLKPFVDKEVEYSPAPRMLDWTKLPADLSYLREFAAKYGVNQFEEDRRRLAKEISDIELAELAALADRVRQPGEMDRIYEWRMQYDGDPEPELVAWLVQILNDLVPRLPKDKSKLDWKKLPNKLRYLAEPASIYGYYWLGVDRDKLLKEISHRDLLALSELAKKIRSPREFKSISRWLAQYGLHDYNNPEATLVYYLLEVLGEFAPEF